MTEISLQLPSDVIDQIASRAAEIVFERMKADQPSWPEWMDAATAARFLNVTPHLLQHWQESRMLPYHQQEPGGEILFNSSEVEAAYRDVLSQGLNAELVHESKERRRHIAKLERETEDRMYRRESLPPLGLSSQ